MLISLLIACDGAKSHLDQIHERGELRVLTLYGPTTYYMKGNELAGIEYELAQRFAEYLNVKLNIIVVNNLSDTFQRLKQGDADMAAAALSITPHRKKHLHFGPVYQEITQQLVYRNGNKIPQNITDLSNGQLEVVAKSSHVEQLNAYKEDIPELTWTENKELDNSGLLELVELEMIDYTIVDSNELIANQTLFPELRVAFDVSEPQSLAWAVPLSEDGSLSDQMDSFFEQIEESGELDRLIEKYYGHIRRFDYIDTRTYYRRIQTLLPKYEKLFKEAGEKFGFDWRLLAAISYQESHWDPQAVSSTGVRGLMMLTHAAAQEMGIDNREDPAQSIDAGAGYLASMAARLPARINEPDKTWIALAAYNLGLGHIEDIRVLTESNGKSPDIWPDIKEFLPLLTKKKWYSQTRYGYAAGGAPVRYVENVRRYYDILLRGEVSSDNALFSNKISNSASQQTPAAL